jgi:hypothetical protein
MVDILPRFFQPGRSDRASWRLKILRTRGHKDEGTSSRIEEALLLLRQPIHRGRAPIQKFSPRMLSAVDHRPFDEISIIRAQASHEYGVLSGILCGTATDGQGGIFAETNRHPRRTGVNNVTYGPLATRADAKAITRNQKIAIRTEPTCGYFFSQNFLVSK